MKIVDEGINWGVYKAYTRGRPIMDEDGNYLNIASMRGDQRRIRELIHAAESFGLDEISVEFIPGARQIDDEEYEQQVDRLREGYVPDKYDLGNLIDEMNYKKANGFDLQG